LKLGLCSRCNYHEAVTSKEVGVVLDRCGKFEVAIDQLQPPVTNCTGFDATDIPYIFERAALIISKDQKGWFWCGGTLPKNLYFKKDSR